MLRKEQPSYSVSKGIKGKRYAKKGQQQRKEDINRIKRDSRDQHEYQHQDHREGREEEEEKVIFYRNKWCTACDGVPLEKLWCPTGYPYIGLPPRRPDRLREDIHDWTKKYFNDSRYVFVREVPIDSLQGLLDRFSLEGMIFDLFRNKCRLLMYPEFSSPSGCYRNPLESTVTVSPRMASSSADHSQSFESRTRIFMLDLTVLLLDACFVCLFPRVVVPVSASMVSLDAVYCYCRQPFAFYSLDSIAMCLPLVSRPLIHEVLQERHFSQQSFTEAKYDRKMLCSLFISCFNSHK